MRAFLNFFCRDTGIPEYRDTERKIKTTIVIPVYRNTVIPKNINLFKINYL